MILSKLDLGNVLERKTTEVKCSSHPSNEGTHYEHDLSPCFLSVIALMFFHIFYFYFSVCKEGFKVCILNTAVELSDFIEYTKVYLSYFE